MGAFSADGKIKKQKPSIGTVFQAFMAWKPRRF